MILTRPFYASPPAHPAVVSAWVSTWGPWLNAAGLDLSEGLVLSALWEADGATERDLTRRVHASSEIVSGCVESLDLLGYTERDGDDVWLTDDGFRLCEHASETWR